jgi:zinc protease
MKHKLYKKTLPNSMRLLFIPLSYTDVVSIGIFVKTGSRYENKKNNGIAHFLEHMMFKGTKKRPSNKISKQLDNVGAGYNAATSYETTYYYIYGHKNDTKLFIDIIVDLYSNPLFKTEDIKKERNVVLEEYNMYNDDIGEILMEEIQKKMYNNSPLGMPILGTPKNIKNFSRTDLVKFRKKFYIPSRTVLVISGNFDRHKVYDQLYDLFKRPTKYTKNRHLTNVKSLLQIKRPIKQTMPYVYIKEDNSISQSQVVFAFKAYSMHHKKTEVLDLIETVLSSGSSSRLFHLLRNKLGLTYFNGSDNIGYIDEGIFTIHIGVDNNNILTAINAILKELTKLKKKGITKEEYKKIKKLKTSSFSTMLQTPIDFVRYYGLSELIEKVDIKNKHREVKPYDVKIITDKYNKITIKQINSMIKDIFKSKQLNIFIYGSVIDHHKLGKIIAKF